MLRLAALFLSVSISTASYAKQDQALLDRYFELFRMEEVFEILRQEGLESGRELAEQDQAISASPAWMARLNKIYDTEKMAEVFRTSLDDVDNLDSSSDVLNFFESDLGKEIIAIELDARRALMDDTVEEALADQVAHMETTQADRLSLYHAFIQANGLIENNVMGALNSNLAFYRGLSTGEGYAEAMSESFMLSTVWEQEPEIRKEMEDWTINFSVMAYAPLTDDEVQAYIDASETPSGQKLNTALFAGFDALFESQSFELGRAMAEFMAGEDT